jgi:uncharacterized protein (TIGR02246 family)
MLRAVLCVVVVFGALGSSDAAPGRPVLVTVDDLPIALGSMHEEPAERERITRDLLANFERHGVRAVGMVTWRNVRGPSDLGLLEMWLEAGHELGNHSYSHLDYTTTGIDEYVADIERGRVELARFLEPHSFAGPAGYGLWDRLASERLGERARQEVQAHLDDQIEAWNRGDLEAFCAGYDEDALFVSPSGSTRGRDDILSRYRKRYTDREAMGTLGFEVLEMRPVQGVEVSMLGDSRPGGVHAVSVAARWSLGYPDREEASGLTLIVLKRRGDRWSIIHDASM